MSERALKLAEELRKGTRTGALITATKTGADWDLPAVAAIIDRHFAGHEEMLAVLMSMANDSCFCGSNTEPNWHSERCFVRKAQTALRRAGMQQAGSSSPPAAD